MGREYSRAELLTEAEAAAAKLWDFRGWGDSRRFADDPVFEYGVAFAWLRLTEPIAQLVARKLVAKGYRENWDAMREMRNVLVHERAQDIDFPAFWRAMDSRLVGLDLALRELLAT